MKNNAIIVDYYLNGNWKHKELIIGSTDFSVDNVSNDEILRMICKEDTNHEITANNVACFIRVLNWDKDIIELEKLSNSHVSFKTAFQGYVTMFVVVNDDLFNEWIKT